VQEHGPTHTPCSFVRTAHSAGKSATNPTSEKRAKRLDPPVSKPQPAPPKTRTKTVKTVKGVECPVCGRTVPLSGRIDLQAHKKATTGRWCKGGKTPTDAEKRKAAGKRSVWTVSGGLPGLGRRR